MYIYHVSADKENDPGLATFGLILTRPDKLLLTRRHTQANTAQHDGYGKGRERATAQTGWRRTRSQWAVVLLFVGVAM